MDWLYETRCDRCDGRATTAYTVYSLRLPVPALSGEGAAVRLRRGGRADGRTASPRTISVCPHCYSAGHEEEISTRRASGSTPMPVLVSYECQEGCKPKRGERRHNDPDPKKRRVLRGVRSGQAPGDRGEADPALVPPHRMMNVESDTEPWGDEWRPGRRLPHRGRAVHQAQSVGAGGDCNARRASTNGSRRCTSVRLHGHRAEHASHDAAYRDDWHRRSLNGHLLSFPRLAREYNADGIYWRSVERT